jgi:CRP/FNR family transcriptional regulator, transcriptional activator FtrB
MRAKEHELIRSLPLFQAVSAANFEALTAAAFLQRFPEGVTLINEGDLPDFLHVVIEGTVELFAKHGRHETTLDILQPVTTFILAAVIRDEVYLKSARTLTPAQVLMIPAQAVRDVFDHDAGFARAIVNELAMRYRGIVRALKNEKLRTSAERLANWILLEEARQGHRGKVDLLIDKRTLASRLGMTPENLSRNLAHLSEFGVRNAGHTFVVEDQTALAQFASPNPLMDS